MDINNLLADERILKSLNKLPKDRESPFIIRGGELLFNINYSKNPDNVLIDSGLVIDGDIVGHTHYLDSQAGRFSLKDIITAKKKGCKILLYHVKTKEFDYYDPEFPHPYPLILDKEQPTIKSFLQLRYEPIRCDCYSYARDVAMAIYGLKLPDLFKTNMKYLELKKIFTEPEKIGFRKTFNFKPGNFVLMNLSVDIPFHMGILIDENVMLHALSEKHPTGLLNIEHHKKNILGVYEFIN
jgi:hypothetical protein